MNSSASDSVRYPPSISSSNQLEFAPYGRFAYNLLSRGKRLLASKNLPDSIVVDFQPSEKLVKPFALYVGIHANQNAINETTGFTISSSSMTPPVLCGICHAIEQLFAQSVGRLDVATLNSAVLTFFDQLSRALSSTAQKDTSEVIARFYGEIGLDQNWNRRTALYFDVASKFIANHEIAHAYTGQLTYNERLLRNADDRAFEIIVDLLSATWLYNDVVRGTPNSNEYRRHHGFANHSEAIRENAKLVGESLLIVFVFMCIASAVSGDGRVRLDSSPNYPNTLLRYWLQQMHFLTLVQSNQLDHFGGTQPIEYWMWDSVHLISSGLITTQQISLLRRQTTSDDGTKVAKLIREFDIEELKPAIDFLGEIGEFFEAVSKASGFAE